MTYRKPLALTAAVSMAALLSGCGAVSHLNPFDRGGGKASTLSQGERIPVIFGDDTVTPADALKGQDFFLPPPAPVASWPLPGGPPDQPVENAAVAPDFQVAWRKGVGEGANRAKHLTAPPVVADGHVFTMDARAYVVATDARTGARVWAADLRGHDKRDHNAWGGGVAYADGKLYVTSGYRFIAALDAASGAVLWRTPVEDPIHGAPTVAGDKVLAVDLDDQLLAFDAKTGAVQWNYQALEEPARILSASSPVSAEGTVVAAFASGELIAFLQSNGNDVWSQSLSRSSRNNALSEIRDVAGRPVIFKGDVFASSHSGVFADVDLHSGGGKWLLPVASITTPWPAGDVVYIVSKAGELICVARESGQVYWIVDLNKGFNAPKPKKRGLHLPGRGSKAPPYWFGPVLASNNLVVVSSLGQALALDPKTGAVRNSLNLGGPALIAPVPAAGMLYVITDKADLVAIR